ncbi:MAG: dolichyl-phosphate beta-glucosyltransferase [Candidatus Parcubacteria bacterium]|nr:dolichyl-phosphate beta-glucosyltransferase [Candidatus Parcubacteria bacterium]
MRLSVIIPAYNEEKRLARTLQSVSEYLSRGSYDYEIIIVNDGSTDGTAELARRLAKSFPHMRLIDNSINHGKGFAVRAGMLAAAGDYRLFMDADGSTPIEEVEKFWPFFARGCPVTIGSRRVPGAFIRTEQPWNRLFLGWVLRQIVRVIVGTRIVDSQNGFKMFESRAAEEIFSRQTVSGWAFDIEILAIAHALGFSVAEIPIVWTDDSESKVDFRGMIAMFKEVVVISRNAEKGNLRRFSRFAMVGTVGYLISAILLFILPRMIGIEALSWALATEAAIINNFMFHNIWTFRDLRVRGQKSCFIKFLQFNLTSAGALVIQTVLGTVAVATFGPEYRQLILPVIVVSAVAPYNWFMYKRYIWRMG